MDAFSEKYNSYIYEVVHDLVTRPPYAGGICFQSDDLDNWAIPHSPLLDLIIFYVLKSDALMILALISDYFFESRLLQGVKWLHL
jgi:hypothetical protein